MGVLAHSLRAQLEDIRAQHERPEAALMPAFWAVQEALGCVSDEAVAEVAALLGVDAAVASGVRSFYTLFDTRPRGTHVIQVCRTLSCAMLGAESLLRHLEQRLGIREGETTDDGQFTLRTAECLASCGTAPVMLIDDTLYENLTPERVDKIVEGLRSAAP